MLPGQASRRAPIGSSGAPTPAASAVPREMVVPLLSIDAYASMTVLIGRAVVIGSAWRCATFQKSPSRRKLMVTRSAIGVMFSLPDT
jgi:hypothetical protein